MSFYGKALGHHHHTLFKKKMTTCGEYILLNHNKIWFDYNDNKAKIV